MNQRIGILRLGTSGIAVPGNKLSHPEKYRLKSRLNYYSSLFDTLEVNSSFYKVPRPATFEKWSNDVPENFQFTLKLWRGITHVKALNFDPADIDAFLHAGASIRNKKGCLLVQFPGKITLEYFDRVQQLLYLLTSVDTYNEWRKAIEFRNSGWYTGETRELLDEYGASLVLHDIPKSKMMEATGEEPFIYFRFHGPTGDYKGSYSDDFLRQKSAIIQGLLHKGKDVYAYFNNTAGNAFENALRLRQLTGSGSI